jgi:hypothetical protein
VVERRVTGRLSHHGRRRKSLCDRRDQSATLHRVPALSNNQCPSLLQRTHAVSNPLYVMRFDPRGGGLDPLQRGGRCRADDFARHRTAAPCVSPLGCWLLMHGCDQLAGPPIWHCSKEIRNTDGVSMTNVRRGLAPESRVIPTVTKELELRCDDAVAFAEQTVKHVGEARLAIHHFVEEANCILTDSTEISRQRHIR